jgi:hypothetical protein
MTTSATATAELVPGLLDLKKLTVSSFMARHLAYDGSYYEQGLYT